MNSTQAAPARQAPARQKAVEGQDRARNPEPIRELGVIELVCHWQGEGEEEGARSGPDAAETELAEAHKTGDVGQCEPRDEPCLKGSEQMACRFGYWASGKKLGSPAGLGRIGVRAPDCPPSALMRPIWWIEEDLCLRRLRVAAIWPRVRMSDGLRLL